MKLIDADALPREPYMGDDGETHYMVTAEAIANAPTIDAPSSDTRGHFLVTERYGQGGGDNIKATKSDTISRAEATMTEEVREALMRLTMCAREECGMCKYKDECDFDFQYKISTDNMNTLADALLRSRCEVDAKSAEAVPQLKQTDTLILADALRYLAKDTERHLSDRTRADSLRQQFLKYGARMKGGDSE